MNRALLPRSKRGCPNWCFRRGICNHGIAAKVSETLIDAKKCANFATPQEAFMSGGLEEEYDMYNVILHVSNIL